MPFMQDLFNVIPAIEGRDIILVIILIFGTLIEIYRGFKEFKFLTQPRYRLKAGIGIGLFVVIVFVWWRQWISSNTFIIALLFWAGILVILYLSVKKIIWPFSFIFNKIRMYVKSGDDENAKKLLSRFRWLCIEPLMHYEWCRLCACTHLIKENPKKAYETLLWFNENYLFENERTPLKLSKAEYLVMLGNYVGAKNLITDLKNLEGETLLERAHVISLCYEMQGNLAEASDTLISAVSSCENLSSEFLPNLLNNLGRIRKLEGNGSDALLYYEKAAKSAVASGNKSLLHITYQNLILSYAVEENYVTAEKWLNDYRSRMDSANVNDLHELFNLSLDYYRQLGNKEKIIDVFEKGQAVLYPKLTEHQKLIYDICELRIRWNSGLLKPAFLTHIEQQFDKYLQLPIPEKYYFLKESHIVLTRLHETGQLGDNSLLFEWVLSNLKEMESELEKYLVSLPEYCVEEKCSWVWELIGLQKNNPHGYDYNKIIKRLIDLKETRMKYGNYLAGINVGLDICDEAMFQQKKDVVAQYLQETLAEIKNLKEPSIHPEMYIRISRYAYYLGQMKCSREMFNKFLKSNINVDHYADWIQGYYHYLWKNLSVI